MPYLKDKQIVRLYRSIGLGLILASAIYLVLSESTQKWLAVLVGWILFAASSAAYQYLIHRRSDANLKRIFQKTGGTLKRGNYIFSTPPSIKFRYGGKACQIGHSIDTKFDSQIEYICQTDLEMELRITRRNNQQKTPRRDFVERFSVTGENRDFADILSVNPRDRRILEELMEDFGSFYLGKDGQMKLVETFDSFLTAPEIAFPVFNKMIKLADFFETESKKSDQ